jgi:hypothetical protein
MLKRVRAAAVAVILLGGPAFAAAQEEQAGVAIDHKAIGCIVAEKFPKMNACFSPSSNLARARVYFRAEGGTSWYYVEMKSDAPCMTGILPKPRKEMIDKHVDYYIHATDKSFAEARTLEYDPIVVAKESDCKDKPLAAYLSKAPVQVFPAVPAGFAAGGLGAGAAIGGGLALAGATVGIYAATNGSDTTTTTTFGGTPGTTQPTAGGTTTTVTPGTTVPPAATWSFRFSLSPTRGPEPLQVTVDMCASSPNTSLKYFYDFNGDGVEDFEGPFCQQTRTYYLDGVQVYPSGRQPPPTAAAPQPKTWTVEGCAEPRNPALTPQERRCATGKVIVDPVSSPTTTPGPGPTGRPSDPGSANQVSWSSDLQVAGASGQVVTNGSSAAFVASGRAATIGVSAGQVGRNRIEAQLVQAAGKPGTWRFDLGSTPGFVAGSLRVVAGDLALATADALVFRMKGVPGERVVFTFAKEF